MYLRSIGFRPWKPINYLITITPDSKLARASTSLGYEHFPGKFNVTLPTGYKFKLTHWTDSSRATRMNEEQESNTGNLKNEIWILGGSYTHGWSVDDEDTFPWLIQDELPKYNISNFGVTGYGTLQSYFQLLNSLKRKQPKIVILNYCDFDAARNIGARSHRRAVVNYGYVPHGPFLSSPYASIDKFGNLKVLQSDETFLEFPFMRHLALSHFIESTYTKKRIQTRLKKEVTHRIIDLIQKLSIEHSFTFVLTNMTRSIDMQDYCTQNGIHNADISIDLNLPENRNRPHDFHPSVLAHQIYAYKLTTILKRYLNEV